MKSILRFIGFVFFVYFILSGLINLQKKEAMVSEVCVDGYEVTNEENDRLHQRDWEAVSSSASFCASYQSRESVSRANARRRNEITYKAFGYEDLWGTVYKNLIKDSKSTIGFLVDSLLYDFSPERSFTK